MIININGVSREMTAEEVERFNSLTVLEPPSQLDLIEAQVLYTALLTDTLLEEE